MLDILNDEFFMKEAMKEARKAFEEGEVPVGAVVVANKQIIARAHNQTELLNDVTAHAEILAITSAANYLGSKYLPQCTLYVTLEPCVMCAGAIAWAQMGKLVFGAADLKKGFLKHKQKILHPKTVLIKGIQENVASQMLTEFFAEKRTN